uniref:ATP synthase complex subunit 8 n=1 Tax=Cassida viridis TaxID=877894 RepID=A0A3G1GRK0_9CUCU|nr:ATP synthase F0 subunit 8 [Cassida viridis]
MPQMAPLNWLSLFILMFLITIIMMTMIYFSFVYNKKMKKMHKKIYNNWKW